MKDFDDTIKQFERASFKLFHLLQNTKKRTKVPPEVHAKIKNCIDYLERIKTLIK